jgi:hypothetical protein
VDAKRTTLRMIPDWLHILMADDGKGTVGAANGALGGDPTDAGCRRQDLGGNMFYGG